MVYRHHTELKNIFHFAEFDLVVSYKTETGEYKEIDAETAIFDDRALYEPGYVQVVYLKVENRGDVDFNYTAAVSVTDYTPATNAFGQTFHLQDYLRFGMVFADREEELMSQLASRELAEGKADIPLNIYSTVAVQEIKVQKCSLFHIWELMILPRKNCLLIAVKRLESLCRW